MLLIVQMLVQETRAVVARPDGDVPLLIQNGADLIGSEPLQIQ